MASHAILDISDAFISMAGSGTRLVVAGVAGIAHQDGWVAGFAPAGASMVHRESMRAIELSRRPAICVMAGDAIRAKQAFMICRLCVTTHACCRRALEHIVHMALGALEALVSAGQGKSRFGVVESRIRPAIRCVAGAAVLAKLPIVVVILGVTGVTTSWCAFKDAIDVTSGAGNCLVAPYQRESRF